MEEAMVSIWSHPRYVWMAARRDYWQYRQLMNKSIFNHHRWKKQAFLPKAPTMYAWKSVYGPPRAELWTKKHHLAVIGGESDACGGLKTSRTWINGYEQLLQTEFLTYRKQTRMFNKHRWSKQENWRTYDGSSRLVKWNRISRSEGIVELW